LSSEEFPELIDKEHKDEPTALNEDDFRFFDYHPSAFAKFRSLDGISAPEYLRSLDVHNFMSGTSLKISDGKSGSFFCFSPDKKFIIKTLFPDEAKFLHEITPSLSTYLAQEKNSLVTKFYGFHGVQIPYGQIIHMVVMRNVFDTSLPIHEVYDLKGSHRTQSKRRRPTKIKLDLDFKRKLNLTDNMKIEFFDQIAKDAKFLADLTIIDFSLLVGLHSFVAGDEHRFHNDNKWQYGILSRDESEIYFMGIIDILQHFNWIKKLESFYKADILRRPRSQISCIPPSQYAERFVDMMRGILY